MSDKERNRDDVEERSGTYAQQPAPAMVQTTENDSQADSDAGQSSESDQGSDSSDE